MTKSELSDEFQKNLLDTNRGYNFYIDWANIKLDGYDVELCALDALIGKQDDFDSKFIELLEKIPSVVQTFPFLFALSKDERKALIKNKKGNSTLKIIGTSIEGEDSREYSFAYRPTDGPFSQEQKQLYLEFFEKMGLKNLYQNIIEKSTYDYIIGVLVGLDSNGRKNRGGKAFELACEPIIREICKEKDVEVYTQKQFKFLRKKGFEIDKLLERQRADFILLKNGKCLNIEVNFYSGTGSKPDSIIGSYVDRQSDLSNNSIAFALVTDGKCWRGERNHLKNGFEKLSYLMNYRMCKNGMLQEVIDKVFG